MVNLCWQYMRESPQIIATTNVTTFLLQQLIMYAQSYSVALNLPWPYCLVVCVRAPLAGELK
jgi:hypothetical protein